jgi:hypothetical protein
MQNRGSPLQKKYQSSKEAKFQHIKIVKSPKVQNTPPLLNTLQKQEIIAKLPEI